MLQNPHMSEDKVVNYTVRLPLSLKNQLRDDAKEQGRSLNSHFVWVIEQYLDLDFGDQDSQQQEAIAKILDKFKAEIFANLEDQSAQLGIEADQSLCRLLAVINHNDKSVLRAYVAAETDTLWFEIEDPSVMKLESGTLINRISNSRTENGYPYQIGEETLSHLTKHPHHLD